ncbi:Alkaline phosphatase [Candidatus Methylobacter favarea]|uniref:Alkaline phosphatase n=1 Tax=Candidatus Methylobacter favarea TaxID=2707345 RepID=A0A8S0Y9H3_9GAMM|nr:alkaline phosphatase [Candidatus Methylobacter favarea]CAA9890138.1 Alkaline phosphatase [Candidatus Methylobacter favarea]
MKNNTTLLALTVASILAAGADKVHAAPLISRLTPPSQLFATNGSQSDPMIARFAPGQRFDLQATVRPDTGTAISQVAWLIDGRPLSPAPGTTRFAAADAIAAIAPNAVVASLRGYSTQRQGLHTFTAIATQSDHSTVTATGNFEIVKINRGGRKAKNVIILLGDGMGASQRAAARIMLNGYSQGKANAKLAMDTFPHTAMIMTASLNSIVTDSSPGMSNYVTGNKSVNNQEGVWPDDTLAKFDNPRVEYLSEYLARRQGKKLGIVTTADVFDATPAAMAIHTQDRGAGTGIVDQYFDDAHNTGLTVLMGGGRKWFLPKAAPGSARSDKTDYVLPQDIVTAWHAAGGALDSSRDLIGNFQAAGWTYASDKTSMEAAGIPDKLLGLFSYSNMNVALDKIDGRRGSPAVVNDYGFTDQPMLDEMAAKAIEVLDANSPDGFVLMVEGASIDKQAHNMDSERMILDTIEFDRAVKVAKDYAAVHRDTLVLVTADHECAGATIIGASKVTDAVLQAKTNTPESMRDSVVGLYEAAGFPQYTIASDGYPTTTDVDKRLLIGYGANADRYEDWQTNAQPAHDSQQALDKESPLSSYPRVNIYDKGSAINDGRLVRDSATGFFVTGQVPGITAAHSGGDIPLSAYGRGSELLDGTIDNTDVFFSVIQAVAGGVK